MAGMIVIAVPEVRLTAAQVGGHYATLGVSWRSLFLAVLAGVVITLLTRMQHAAFTLDRRPAGYAHELNRQSGGRRDGLVERSSATQLPHDQEHTTGQLVAMLSEQVSVLIRDELKLARLEMTSKGKQAALGAGAFGASGVTAIYGVGCLLACAIIAISGAVAAWLAALIVGTALLAVAGCAALLGKWRLARAAPPVPEQAVASVRADVEEIKERTHQ